MMSIVVLAFFLDFLSFSRIPHQILFYLHWLRSVRFEIPVESSMASTEVEKLQKSDFCCKGSPLDTAGQSAP